MSHLSSKIRHFTFDSKGKSCLETLFKYLSNYIELFHPHRNTEPLQKLISGEAIKLTLKSVFYTSNIGLDYLNEVALFVLYNNIYNNFNRFFVYGPELMIHLSKDIASAGVYHTDCSKETLNYYTVWSPLFDCEYRQISFREENKSSIAFSVPKEQAIVFPGNLEHKGNFNYTDSGHCAVVSRVTFDEPLHNGKYIQCVKNKFNEYMIGNSRYTNHRWKLSNIKYLYDLSFSFLSDAASNGINSQNVENYINNIPYKSQDSYYYKLFFEYEYLNKFFDMIGIDASALSDASRRIFDDDH